MGVFDDKKFEQLDWMTQMTETIDSDINELLARLPERIEVDADSLLTQLGSSYGSLTVSSVVRKFIEDRAVSSRLSWEEEQKIFKCFNFQLSEEVELNAETRTLTGTVTLVKVVQTLSDEELQPIMGAQGVETLGRLANRSDLADVSRSNEILDILGNCKEAMRTKSGRKKIRAIQSRLRDVFRTNEWRIRDMNLANKVSVWIADYIMHGNLAALTNLCKLKVMTHNNMPIYSVEEEK